VGLSAVTCGCGAPASRRRAVSQEAQPNVDILLLEKKKAGVSLYSGSETKQPMREVDLSGEARRKLRNLLTFIPSFANNHKQRVLPTKRLA